METAFYNVIKNKTNKKPTPYLLGEIESLFLCDIFVTNYFEI